MINKKLWAVLVLMTIPVAGCSSPQNEASSETSTTAAAGSSDKPAAAPKECDKKNVDVIDTGLDEFVGGGMFPVEYYSPQDQVKQRDQFAPDQMPVAPLVDNQFDPCAKLSWMIVEDITEKNRGQSVILFAGDKLVKNVATPMFEKVSGVEKLSDEKIKVNYLVKGEAHSETYTLEDDGVIQGDQTYARPGIALPASIRFDYRPMPTERRLYKLGNKYGPGYDKVMANEGTIVTPFTAKLSDSETLLCYLVPNAVGHGPAKWGSNPTYMLTPNPGWKKFEDFSLKLDKKPELGSGLGDANAFRWNYMPDAIVEVSKLGLDQDPMFQNAPAVAENGRTLVDNTIVDTTKPGEVRFQKGEKTSQVVVTHDGVQVVPFK